MLDHSFEKENYHSTKVPLVSVGRQIPPQSVEACWDLNYPGFT